jgi:tRNA-dihydrouridine synthase
VRIEAARAIAIFDKWTAGRLLVREFTGRFVYGCVTANRALNELTAQNRTVDCRDPQARSKAAAEWDSVVNGL